MWCNFGFCPGVFFIPYILFLFACGIPLFLLETSLGQYTKQGGITCWKKICPLFEGKNLSLKKKKIRMCDNFHQTSVSWLKQLLVWKQIMFYHFIILTTWFLHVWKFSFIRLPIKKKTQVKIILYANKLWQGF